MRDFQVGLWRSRTKDNDPKTATSGMQALEQIIGQERARAYPDLKRKLMSKDKLRKAVRQRDGFVNKQGKEIMAAALLLMVPWGR